MSIPVRQADVVKAWADGADIECRALYTDFAGPWKPVVGGIPPFNDSRYELRVAHSTQPYRVAEMRSGFELCFKETESARDDFVRWVTPWKEMETP